MSGYFSNRYRTMLLVKLRIITARPSDQCLARLQIPHWRVAPAYALGDGGFAVGAPIASLDNAIVHYNGVHCYDGGLLVLLFSDCRFFRTIPAGERWARTRFVVSRSGPKCRCQAGIGGGSLLSVDDWSRLMAQTCANLCLWFCRLQMLILMYDTYCTYPFT